VRIDGYQHQIRTKNPRPGIARAELTRGNLTKELRDESAPDIRACTQRCEMNLALGLCKDRRRFRNESARHSFAQWRRDRSACGITRAPTEPTFAGSDELVTGC
jgi:hypothetical protein